MNWRGNGASFVQGGQRFGLLSRQIKYTADRVQAVGHAQTCPHIGARQGCQLTADGKRVYIAVDDDAQRARRRISETLHRFYPFFQLSHLEAFPVYGPPDACVRGLREVAEAGAELILLNPVFDEAEQMERLAAEVVPKLS